MMPEVQVTTDGPVVTVTIDRPHARNAVSLATMGELEHALLHVQEQGDASVLVLRGGGDRAFVSGGDLKDLARIETHEEAAAMATRMRRVLDTLVNLPIPTIAALNGHALGGGAEVAVACDLRLAANDVSIAFNQADLAIMPAWGGVERLVDLVGRSAAMHLLLSRSRITAARAEMLGLLNGVLARDKFDNDVAAYARAIAELPRSVPIAIKSIVSTSRPNSHPSSEAPAVDAFARLWVSDDHWSAVQALQHRRRS